MQQYVDDIITEDATKGFRKTKLDQRETLPLMRRPNFGAYYSSHPQRYLSASFLAYHHHRALATMGCTQVTMGSMPERMESSLPLPSPATLANTLDLWGSNLATSTLTASHIYE